MVWPRPPFYQRPVGDPDVVVVRPQTGADADPAFGLLAEPIVVIEILSPSNANDTWGNVVLYTTIPSVREILVCTRRMFAPICCAGRKTAPGRTTRCL
jgi:Uma2 family endonuclease